MKILLKLRYLEKRLLQILTDIEKRIERWIDQYSEPQKMQEKSLQWTVNYGFGNDLHVLLTKAWLFVMRPEKSHLWFIRQILGSFWQTWKDLSELNLDLSGQVEFYCRKTMKSEMESQEDRFIKGMTEKRPPGEGAYAKVPATQPLRQYLVER